MFLLEIKLNLHMNIQITFKKLFEHDCQSKSFLHIVLFDSRIRLHTDKCLNFKDLIHVFAKNERKTFVNTEEHFWLIQAIFL